MTNAKQVSVECTRQQIPAGEVSLESEICLPPDAKGLVVFIHGSGSNLFSPRNTYVARIMRDRGLATLLFTLLTKEEQAIDMETAKLRFDIPFLASRLLQVTDWVKQNPTTRHYLLGYFGASTGASAALVAAAERSDIISAVVSRGGRTDLAGEALARIKAPTLLIVGSLDVPVLELNRQTMGRLRGEKELAIVPGASHLFEEERALDDVARLASDWFLWHFQQPPKSKGRKHNEASHF